MKATWKLALVWVIVSLFLVLVWFGGAETGLTRGHYYFFAFLLILGFLLMAWNNAVLYLVAKDRAFGNLKKLGFAAAPNEDALVYTGVYRNYFMEVYYSTFTVSNYGEIWVTLYYNSMSTDQTENLKKTHDNTGGFYIAFKRWLKVDDNTIVRNAPFFFWFSFNYIKKQMDYVADIADKEHLQPLLKAEVDAL